VCYNRDEFLDTALLESYPAKEGRTLNFCQNCSHSLELILNLGDQPLCNAFLNSTEEFETEKFYPLRLAYCKNCSLTQLTDVLPRELVFGKDFNYLSSSSKSVVEYYQYLAEKFIRMFRPTSVLEIASNDGVFLQPFKKQGIKVLGVEPAPKPAQIAIDQDIPTRVEYFEDCYQDIDITPDIICAFDVLAHCERLDSFLFGITQLMKQETVLILQCQSLDAMLESVAFDTAYHEHLRYFDVTSLKNLLSKYNLRVVDVEFTDFYGGSFLSYCRLGDVPSKYTTSPLTEKKLFQFAKLSQELRNNISITVESRKEQGPVIGIGAPMKSSTLLNYCNLKLEYLTEVNQLKIGTFSPGMHIPVVDENKVDFGKETTALVLSWNMYERIVSNLRQKGFKGQFIVPIPVMEIL